MTTYYIRTLSDTFSFNCSSIDFGLSDNLYFEEYVESAMSAPYSDYGCRTNPGRILGTANTKYYAFSFNIGTRDRLPSYPTTVAGQLITTSGTDGYFYWSNYEVDDDRNAGYCDYTWSAKGWSDPYANYTTWLTNLCTKFNSLDKDSIVTNNSNINVVVLKYKFLNSPSADRQAYFPIFYAGNDPNYEQIITI